jgi:dTDP-4-dehydrorhamnose 3,5-epimerase-like enzyme
MNDLVASVPFDVKRFMEISNVPNGETRGYHAHKENEQLLLCFSGSVVVRTEIKNEAGEIVEQTHNLEEGDFLYMPPLTWGEQTYYGNAVLHVLCSKKFDEQDYIREYEQFKEY